MRSVEIAGMTADNTVVGAVQISTASAFIELRVGVACAVAKLNMGAVF